MLCIHFYRAGCKPSGSIQNRAAAVRIVAPTYALAGCCRFIPMSALFFLMAFVNTIIDSLKDSLVITAVGGGTEVLPYLSGEATPWPFC